MVSRTSFPSEPVSRGPDPAATAETTLESERYMLLVVTIIAVGCLPALAAAFSLPDEILAWCCVVISAVGLVMLIVEGRMQRRRSDADSRGTGSATDLDADASAIDAHTETFAVAQQTNNDDGR